MGYVWMLYLLVSIVFGCPLSYIVRIAYIPGTLIAAGVVLAVNGFVFAALAYPLSKALWKAKPAAQRSLSPNVLAWMLVWICTGVLVVSGFLFFYTSLALPDLLLHDSYHVESYFYCVTVCPWSAGLALGALVILKSVIVRNRGIAKNALVSDTAEP